MKLRTFKEIEAEGAAAAVAELKKMELARTTERQKLEAALRGLQAIAQTSADAAAATDAEADAVRAQTLARRLQRAQGAFRKFVEADDALADNRDLKTAQTALDAAVAQIVAKLQKTLPSLHVDEARRLAAENCQLKHEREAVRKAEDARERAQARKIEAARLLWAVFGACGGLVSAPDADPARALIERGLKK